MYDYLFKLLFMNNELVAELVAALKEINDTLQGINMELGNIKTAILSK